MIHKSCLGTCGMIPVEERNKNLNVLSGKQHFTEQWYPINSFFFTEQIRYVHDGFTRSGSVPWDGRGIECTAETIRSGPPDWSSGLEIPFVFSMIPTPIWKPIPAIPCSRLKLAVWLKAASPLPQLWPTLHVSAERKETLPPNTSTHYSIQTDGPGIAVLPNIQMFRLRPWGTRVLPSLKLHLTAGTGPRWCTGRLVPGTSPLGRSLFPPLSWTAETNWPATSE